MQRLISRWFLYNKDRFYGTQVLRTLYEAASD
jgi:hypothetical protein